MEDFEIKEVIEELEFIKDRFYDFPEETGISNDIKNIQNAIKAIKKIEEYKSLEEQGKLLKLPCAVGDTNIAITEAVKALTEIQQYHAIGTVEKCRAAVEKQRVKKPVRRDMCTCPKCGTYNETIKKRRNTVINDIVYCWHCGQAIEVGETV